MPAAAKASKPAQAKDAKPAMGKAPVKKNEGGKIGKPDGWKPPDLRPFV